METESKFLDKNYLTTRLNDFPFKKNGLRFELRDSKNEKSCSLYVDVLKGNLQLTSLRISDHIQLTKETQFILEPTKILCKKKKAEFIRVVNATIKKAQIKMLQRELQKLN